MFDHFVSYGAAVHVDVHIFCVENEKIVFTSDVAELGLQRRIYKHVISTTDSETEDDGIEEVEITPGITHRVQPSVFLATLPVMIGSRLCRLYGLPNERLIELKESL